RPAEEGQPPELTLSPRPVENNGGRGGQAQDPQAEGYWLDIPLTDRLYELLAGDLTNNMDPSDAFRSLSREFKEELDRAAEAFAEGSLSGEEMKKACQGMSFAWPQDKLGLVHPLGEMSARCYTYPGRDMELAKERILLTNVTARHYLFLRVYYHPVQDAVRIYMVNALIY
ncbi:MAG: hypothetical protein J6H18_01160, partial [Lachnospiraceae bacterium]|nr:hypothetical protein [Lachnospiraceae bacterium]